MKNLVLFGIFVLFLVAIQFAGGQTVDEIIKKHIRAKGGFDKLNVIQNIYFEGLITMMGIVGMVKIYKVQNEQNPNGFDMQWQITEQDGTFIVPNHMFADSPLVRQIMAATQIEPDITGPLINYEEAGSKAVLIGKDVVKDCTCYKILLTTNEGRQINYWIDTSNFLLFQLSFKNAEINAGQNSVTHAIFSNYKTVDGFLLAHSTEMTMTGLNENLSVEINFNKITINQPVNVIFVETYNQS